MPRVGRSQGSQSDAGEVSIPGNACACPVEPCDWDQDGNNFRALADHVRAKHKTVTVHDLNHMVFGSASQGVNRFFNCGGCGVWLHPLHNFSRHATMRENHPECLASFRSQEREVWNGGASGSTDDEGEEKEHEENNLPLELVSGIAPGTEVNLSDQDETDQSHAPNDVGSHQDGSFVEDLDIAGLSEEIRDEYLELIAFYGRFPLFVVHKSWRLPLLRIAIRLLNTIVDSPLDSLKADYACVGFLLLPGVARALQRFQFERPIDFLRAVLASPDPALCILEYAQKHRPQIVLGFTQNRDGLSSLGEEKKLKQKVRRLRHRIECLTYEGRLSAATTQVQRLDSLLESDGSIIHEQFDHDPLLQQTSPELTAEAAKALISELHPPARDGMDETNRLDRTDGGTEEMLSLQLSEAEVSAAIESCNSQSSAGYSAWTFAAIQNSLKNLPGTGSNEDVRGLFIQAVTRFFNSMLAGKASKTWWTPSRSVLIPKDGGRGYRPLSIGDTWYRLMGRAVLQALGPELSSVLQPIQLGVGYRGGSEIAGRLQQVALDSTLDLCLFNLDLINAFNMMPRSLMWLALKRYAPDLLAWYSWSYGSASKLYLSDGTYVCDSETGSRQGDPLAALIFCLGLQLPLRYLVLSLSAIAKGDAVPELEDPRPNAIASAIKTSWIDPITGLSSGERNTRNLMRPMFDELETLVQEQTDETGRVPSHLTRELVRRYRDTVRAYDLPRMQVPQQDPRYCPTGVLSYMDDVSVFCHRMHMGSVHHLILKTFFSFGLALNIKKCSIQLCSDDGGQNELYPVSFTSYLMQGTDEDPYEIPEGERFRVSAEPSLSMGVPVGGSVGQRKTLVANRLEKMRVSRKTLATQVSPITVYTLLRFCINARASYLTRVCELPFMREVVELHDAYVDDVLLDMLVGFSPVDALGIPHHNLAIGVQPSATLGEGVAIYPHISSPRDKARHSLVRLRGLPTDRGGLGIVRLAGVAGDISCLKSRQLVLNYLEANQGVVTPFFKAGLTWWRPIVLGQAEESTGLSHPYDQVDQSSSVDETAASDPSAEPQSLPLTLDDHVKLVRKVYRDIGVSLRSMLRRQNRLPELAWFLSSDYSGSGKWLLSGTAGSFYYGHLRFQGEEFRNALRLRCMVNPVPVQPSVAHLPSCACGTVEKPVFLDEEPYHALDCQQGCVNKALTCRHHRVRDVLADVLVNYCGIDKNHVHREATVGRENGPAHLRRRADLVVNLPGVRDNVLIDVAVVNPAARTYIEKGRSHMRQGGASTCRANEKIDYYRRAGLTVVPFVVEASGRLGYHATAFVKHVAEITHVNWRSLRTRFIQAAGIGIQRANGSAASAIVAMKAKYDALGLQGIFLPNVHSRESDTEEE